MAKMKKINKNGEDIYLLTHEDAVLDSNGVSIGEKIKNLEMDRIEVIDFNGDINADIEFNSINDVIMGYKYIFTNNNDDSNNIQAALDEGLNIIIKGEVCYDER